MQRYVPDEVWQRIAPLIAEVPSAGTPRKNQRLAVLGIAIFLAADFGWGNLPSWVGVSASTVRRLIKRLQRNGAWPSVLAGLVAGPWGNELRPERLQ